MDAWLQATSSLQLAGNSMFVAVPPTGFSCCASMHVDSHAGSGTYRLLYAPARLQQQGRLLLKIALKRRGGG